MGQITRALANAAMNTQPMVELVVWIDYVTMRTPETENHHAGTIVYRFNDAIIIYYYYHHILVLLLMLLQF